MTRIFRCTLLLEACHNFTQTSHRISQDRDLLWCYGPKIPGTYIHIFAAFFPDPVIAEAEHRARALTRADWAIGDCVLATTAYEPGTAEFATAVAATRDFMSTL